jgi:hypothetical protein
MSKELSFTLKTYLKVIFDAKNLFKSYFLR